MITRIASLLCLGAGLLGAGEPATWDWPKTILLVTEDVKPGKQAAHEKNEYAWAKALAEAKAPYHYLGMTATAGGSQAFWVWPGQDLASFEGLQAFVARNPALKAQVEILAEQDGTFLQTTRTTLYMLRSDLSRGPVEIAPHYYWVFKDHLRPGHEPDYVAMCKSIMGFHEKAGLRTRFAVYQSLAGTESAHFLVVIPLKGLADLDTMLADEGKFAQAAGEEGLKGLARLEADGVGREASFLLAVEPRLSYPDARTVAADPDFWKDWVK